MKFFFALILSLSLSMLSLSTPILAQTKAGQPQNSVHFQGPQAFTPNTHAELLYQDAILRLELYYPNRQAQLKARVLQAFTPTEITQRNTFFSLRFHPASCDLFILKSTLKGAGTYTLKTLTQKVIAAKIPQGKHQFFFLSVCTQSPVTQRTVAFQLLTPQKSLSLQKTIDLFPCQPTKKVSESIQHHLDRFEAPVDVLSTHIELFNEEAIERFPDFQFWKKPRPHYSSNYLKDQVLSSSTQTFIEHDDLWRQALATRISFTQQPTIQNTILQCVTDFQHERLLERLEVLRQKSDSLHSLQDPLLKENLLLSDNLLRHFFYRVNTSQGINDYYSQTPHDQ